MADTKNSFDAAVEKYPILKKMNLAHVFTPGSSNNMLEFWQPGESGDPKQARPNSIPINQPGVEIYSDKARPIDILGDVVSHYMIKNDPNINKYFSNFVSSLTDQQKQTLKDQYEYAKNNDGEARPIDQWLKESGLPAYFRGYAFDQWPKDFTDKAYTPDQRQMFDEMMGYLQEGQSSVSPEVQAKINQVSSPAKAALGAR